MTAPPGSSAARFLAGTARFGNLRHAPRRLSGVDDRRGVT
jgi:hypothetical protein